MSSVLFPYNLIIQGSKIIIYGAGTVCTDYVMQIKKTNYCEILFAVDKNHADIARKFPSGILVKSPESIIGAVFDYIVIAHTNANIAAEIHDCLLSMGVIEEKIKYKADYDTCLFKQFKKLLMPQYDILPLIKNLYKKKIIIFGDGRAALDLLYVLPDIEVEYFIANSHNEEKAIYLPKPIYEWQILENEPKENLLIIVCSYEPQYAKKKLENLGFIYSEQWLFAEEFALILDFSINEITQYSKIALYVSQKDVITEYLAFGSYYGFSGLDIIATDSTTEDYYLDNIHVTNFNNIILNDYYIILASDYSEIAQLKLKIEDLGINKNYMLWSNNAYLPSKLYYQTMYTMPTEIPIEGNCINLFSYLQIDFAGQASYICCPIYLQPGLGDVNYSPIYDLYHSSTARVIRLSLVNHTFCFCNIHTCSDLIKYRDRYKYKCSIDHICDIKSYNIREDNYPKYIALNIDSSCNLSCVFCRKEQAITSNAMLLQLDILLTKLVIEVIPYIDKILIAGNGEAFFSKIYRKILFNKDNKRINPNLELMLLTNGILFTKYNFELIEPLFKSISLNVSIDAGSKLTYEKIRRLGNWDILVQNMAYAGELRKADRITNFQSSFIVTTENINELPFFIHWMKSINVDCVILKTLHRTDAMTEKEFEELSILDKYGNYKDMSIKLLKDPILDDPIIQKGNFLGRI